MNTLVINFKNHLEILGSGARRLATAAEKVSRHAGTKIIVAPPTPMLAEVASAVKIPVFCQGLVQWGGNNGTAAVLPETIRNAGAAGTILNHSEAPLSPKLLKVLALSSHAVGLETLICVETPAAAEAAAKRKPDYIAVELPELIGTGRPISKEKPKLLSHVLEVLNNARFPGQKLCGSGVGTGGDAEAAIKQGYDGVLVSSAIVKAAHWEDKIAEFSKALRD